VDAAWGVAAMLLGSVVASHGRDPLF
jgi:hypothetical protein